jgi:hypothetical protein
MHDDLATINNKKIEPVSSFEPKTKQTFYKNKFKHFRSDSHPVQDDFIDELFPKYVNFESGIDGLKIMKIFGKLNPHFEELEKLLSHLNKKSKADELTRILTFCLSSYRPIKSMEDTVEMYRAAKGLDKMAYYYSKSKGVSPEMATISLKDKVKNSVYYKKNIN